jgi:hypothetical protein
MTDPKANAKHRIDASKVLDDLADNGPQSSPEQDRVVIRIDLTKGGGDVRARFVNAERAQYAPRKR